jgi:hypothetical protein
MVNAEHCIKGSSIKKTSVSSNFTTVEVNVFKIVVQTMNICCGFVAFRKNYCDKKPFITQAILGKSRVCERMSCEESTNIVYICRYSPMDLDVLLKF